MKRLVLAVLSLLISASSPSRSLAEEVEHPIYRSWAKHKVGTSVTLKSVNESKGVRVESTTKQTLISLDEREAVVETVVTSNATGKITIGDPSKYAHKRMFPLFPGVKKEDIGKPSNRIASGEETITVGGKEYKAQWYDAKSQTEAGEANARTWMSDEVPGKLIKSVNEVKAAKRINTIELVEVKVP